MASSAISVGSAIYSAVRPIFKVYFILLTGFFLARRNWLSVETARNLSNMVLIAFVPCLIIDKIITYLDNGDIKQIGVLVLSAFVMYATGFFYAALLSLVLPVPKRWKGGFIVGCTLPNVSDLPIAYLQSMAGGVIFSDADSEKGVAYIIINLATYTIVQFCCGLFRLVEYDFREIPEDNEKKLTDSSEGEDDEDTHKNSSVDAINRAAAANRRLDENGLQVLDNDGLPLSPTSTLSSASTGVRHEDQDLQVVALNSNGESQSHMRTVRSNVSRRRRASIDTHSSRGSHFSSNSLVREYSRIEPYNSNLTTTMSIMTENVSTKLVKESGASIKFIQKYKLNWLVFVLKNFAKPASLALIFSITMAMIPWCKALFVTTTVYMPSAPDDQPPLTFVIDFAGYLGQACVPLGLLLLGATIARLKVEQMPPKFWQCCVALTGWRLIVMPIWGVLWTNRLEKIGWIDNDTMLSFVIMLQWALPSATVQVYLTASYTDPESEDHIQMDCLAIYVLSQYMLLIVTLPILVTYAIKVELGY